MFVSSCLYGNLLACVQFTSENWTIMACDEEITSRNDTHTVWLTKDDTTGVKLTGPMDSHTMVELKWWLLCHDIEAPNQWNKKKCFKI